MLLVSLSLPSLPLASPRTHRDYVVVSATDCTWASARTRKKRRQRTVKRRAGPHFGGFWRTRARDSFDPAGTPKDEKGVGGGKSEKKGASVRNIHVLHRSFRMRAPLSRCTSHHHFNRNGNDTNGSTPDSPRRKASRRAGRESKEREPDSRWGWTRSLGQVYYLCFTCSGAQRVRPVAVAPGAGDDAGGKVKS